MERTAEDEDVQRDGVMGGHVSSTMSRLFGETPLGSSAETARDRDNTRSRHVERSLGLEGQLENKDAELFLTGSAFGLGSDSVPPPSRNLRMRGRGRGRGQALHSMATRSNATAPASGGLGGGQKKRKRQQRVVSDTDEEGEDDNNDADNGPDGPPTKRSES